MLYIIAFVLVLGAFCLAPKTVLRTLYTPFYALFVMAREIREILIDLAGTPNYKRRASMHRAISAMGKVSSKQRKPGRKPRVQPRYSVFHPFRSVVRWWYDCYRYGRRYPDRAARGLYYGMRLARWVRFK